MILRETERKDVKGERIIKIASSFYYVSADAPVHQLLAELKEPYGYAVAVVDESLRVKGIVIPEELVEMLGKPFGRDLLQRQSVSDIMRPARIFPYDEYTQAIRERIRADLNRDESSHYLLVDESGEFRGHFSSRDVLIHAMSDHERELATATTIQSRLVKPYVAVRNERISITCSSVMAQGVGGDYYFVREYQPGKWFFCLCDISGKGIAAAIITAVLSGFFYNADFDEDVDVLVRRLNRIILDTFQLEKYLTGFFAKFSEKTGLFEYCDMGHSWFFVVEANTAQQISPEADNVPIGLVDDPPVNTRYLRFEPGMAIMLISDGIVEQENRAKEPFPVAEAGRIISESLQRGEDLVRAKIRILESFFSFKQDMPQHDDISFLIFHYFA